jgi:hypothetical protein
MGAIGQVRRVLYVDSAVTEADHDLAVARSIERHPASAESAEHRDLQQAHPAR